MNSSNPTKTQLKSHHRQELKASIIADSLIELNYQSIDGDEVYERLAGFLPNSERRNDGRLRDKWLQLYESAARDGGWWISGLDPLNDWLEEMEWGRLKPDSPRRNWDKDNQTYTDKKIKYESPAKTPNRVTYHQIPLDIWHRVAKRFNVPMPIPETLNFWQWVKQHPEIQIVFTEGEKKAGCLLSMGFPAIALPGIWTGTVKTPIQSVFNLHPDLVPIAQKGRKCVILFDYETKLKTQKQIRLATSRLGKALQDKGCQVDVAVLPGPEKGIDDWVSALGPKAEQAVGNLISDALALRDYIGQFWENQGRGLRKYKPDLVVNTKYLSEQVALPTSGLACLQSDMNTGKTYLLELWRKSNPNQRFLNNGHRVNLLRNLAKRLETEMYSNVRMGDLGSIDALSITADSLYKLAQNLEQYDCVFVDEACQYVVHLLQSKTLKSHRAEILETLEWIIYNAKLVVLADAHLDDTTIAFFQAMRPKGEKPFIIQNKYRSGGRDVHWYEGGNHSHLVAQIHTALLEGKKAMIVSSSKRFIKKLERTLLDLPKIDQVEVSEPSEQTGNGLPGLNGLLKEVGGKGKGSGGKVEELMEASSEKHFGKMSIWTIHSENSGSEENVAFIENINQAVQGVDALLSSPSLGTGVDIHQFHFDVIFGVFEASKLAATDCVQQLWRYRPNVPMHVWVAPRPSFGYSECNARKIKQKILDSNEMTAFLIRIDRETGKRGAEKDWALDAYCQIEAKRNFSINNLRQDLRSLLEEMGNQIITIGGREDLKIKEQIKDAGQALDQEYCQSVAHAQGISKEIFQQRQSKDFLKPEEFFECEKFRIRDSYGAEVTPELVKIDDKGNLITQIANLEAILAVPGETFTDEQGRSIQAPPEIVSQRDLNDRDLYPICTDWGNYSTAWVIRHKLDLRAVIEHLRDGGFLYHDHPLVIELKDKAIRYAHQIKEILGLTVPGNMQPMWYLKYFFQQLGVKLKSSRPGKGNSRVRIYRLDEDWWTFLEQVLDHRQRKREERKRRREEWEEQNQRHQAKMKRLWGLEVASSPPEKSNLETFEDGLDAGKNLEGVVTSSSGSKAK